MHGAGVADHGCDRSLGAQQQLQIAIGAGAHSGTASCSERRDLRVTNFDLFDLFEKRGVALVGARPSALDVIEAKPVEAFSNRDLVFDSQRDVLGLASVAQGRVINLDMFCIRHRAQTLSTAPELEPPLPLINASCSARIASSPYFELTTTETVISEVEIISILIRSFASTWNILAATPACVRIPTPTTETLATWSLCRTPAAPASRAIAVISWSAPRRSSRPTVTIM